MTTFTKELDDILKKRTWWGDYQNDDGTWGTGISNRPELIKAILNLVSERIIGDGAALITPEKYNELYPTRSFKADAAVHYENKAISANNKLRDTQRTTLYEGTKEDEASE